MDDPRREREGLHIDYKWGVAPTRTQVILLDTRWFRSAFQPTPNYGASGMERYVPDPDLSKTMLGMEQWSWLEEKLLEPADLRLIVSSIQVIYRHTEHVKLCLNSLALFHLFKPTKLYIHSLTTQSLHNSKHICPVGTVIGR